MGDVSIALGGSLVPSVESDGTESASVRHPRQFLMRAPVESGALVSAALGTAARKCSVLTFHLFSQVAQILRGSKLGGAKSMAQAAAWIYNLI